MAYTYYLYLCYLAERHIDEPETYWAFYTQIQKVRRCCGLA